MPSLASIKAFSRKNDSLQQHQQQQAAIDAEKNLPSPPGFDSISPISGPSASGASGAMPAKRAPQTFGFDAVPMMDFESSRYPMPSSGPPAGPGNAASGPGPSSGPNAGSPPQPVQRANMPVPMPVPMQNNHSHSSSTGSPADSDPDPLEDYIPDPSPETDEMLYQAAASGPDGPLSGPLSTGPVNGDVHGDIHGDVNGDTENGDIMPVAKDDWEPPMVEIAAPLNKLHFACYQEHRSMPPAANVWHAVPCMTCNKLDREVRHRCVFCCLRICEGCFGKLQKCSRRSLDELLAQV